MNQTSSKIRTVRCRYAAIGCTWSEKYCLKDEHEENCVYPTKAGSELMEAVALVDKKQRDENHQLKNIVKMMSCEKIAICDIQLSPSRTDDYIPRLYYETNRFSAFEQTWVIKAKIVGDEKSCDRKLTYQVCLRGKSNMEVKYLLLKGPFGSSEIYPDLHRFEFKEDNKETEYHPISLASSPDCNRLLAARTINIRLLMFLISKG